MWATMSDTEPVAKPDHSTLRVFTLGHSDHSAEEFVTLLHNDRLLDNTADWLGALSTEHTEEDIAFLDEAARRAARRFGV